MNDSFSSCTNPIKPLPYLDHACSTFLSDLPFVRGRKLLGRKIFGQIVTFYRSSKIFYWVSSDIRGNKCITQGDQKLANCQSSFEWQLTVFYRQHNFLLIAPKVLLSYELYDWLMLYALCSSYHWNCHTNFLGQHERQLHVSARQQPFQQWSTRNNGVGSFFIRDGTGMFILFHFYHLRWGDGLYIAFKSQLLTTFRITPSG